MPSCANCGREMQAEANFCSVCGASQLSPAIDSMIGDARRALTSDPNDADARHNLALAYKHGGMDELALQEFARVAELQPDFGDAHYEIGLLQAKAGRTEEAILALGRALEVDPAHARAKRLLERLRGAS